MNFRYWMRKKYEWEKNREEFSSSSHRCQNKTIKFCDSQINKQLSNRSRKPNNRKINQIFKHQLLRYNFKLKNQEKQAKPKPNQIIRNHQVKSMCFCPFSFFHITLRVQKPIKHQAHTQQYPTEDSNTEIITILLTASKVKHYQSYSHKQSTKVLDRWVAIRTSYQSCNHHRENLAWFY